MSTEAFPKLDADGMVPTRDGLHAYSRVLGGWAAAFRERRKHWWQLSLRPTVRGLTTEMVHAQTDFELELDVVSCRLRAYVPREDTYEEDIRGQSAASISASLRKYLQSCGIDASPVADVFEEDDRRPHANISVEIAQDIGAAWRGITNALVDFRASIKEETSPIGLWPHHVDLAMMWLPGEQIEGQNPDDEEYADKQMNFGFTLGDQSIPKPYFYVTAYPLPPAMRRVALPLGARWHADGFEGAVVRYADLVRSRDPKAYLLDLWVRMLIAGRTQMLDIEN